ncbi:MAG: helix-turn-helix domain-containing protein [Campylobacterota bacterium]
MGKFKEIEDRLKKIFKVNKNIEIANILGVHSSTYGNWKSRDTIPYKEIITICEEKNIDLGLIFFENQNENNTQNVNNYKEELHKLIENLNENDIKKIYHLVNYEILK